MVISASAVTLSSPRSGDNYAEFTFRVSAKGTPLQDGGLAVAGDVIPEGGDADIEPLARNVRMIFVPGTPPLQKVSGGLSPGDELTVIGIPRVNLNALSAFVNAATPAARGIITRKLPYEMIVVAVK